MYKQTERMIDYDWCQVADVDWLLLVPIVKLYVFSRHFLSRAAYVCLPFFFFLFSKAVCSLESASFLLFTVMCDIHVHVCVHVRSFVHACIRAFMHACIRACVHALCFLGNPT